MYPDSEKLARLRDEILAENEEARELWAENQALAHPDGNVRRFRLPVHQGKEVPVENKAFTPLGSPDLRMIVLLHV